MNNTEKWNQRYLQQDTPWETGVHHPEMERLFSRYIQKNQQVLEIGCGSGVNANWLAKNGFRVTAIDVSAEAIRKACLLNSDVDFKALDFLQDDKKLAVFPVIFDCAVLPVLNKEQREVFVKLIAQHCESTGYWINISCSKDQAEEIEKKTGVNAPPYLTAQKIIHLAEPFFELIEMRRCDFVIERRESGTAKFNAWGSVFKRR